MDADAAQSVAMVTHEAVFDPSALAATAGPAVADACATFKTCDSCLNASSLCHFCEYDFQCHVIGSPYGCTTGISQCHHLEDCERSTPQYVGYGPPPAVVIAVLCLMVTLTCCICGVSAICSVFCRRRRPTSRHAAALATIRESKKDKKNKKNLDGPSAMSEQTQPLLLEEFGDELTFTNDMDEDALDRLESRYEHTVEREFDWQTFFTRVTWLATLIAVTVIALMYYPRIPDYNVCNREFDWESILQSLRHLEPKVNYQVLLSIVNENRFGFVIESGRADIYHNGTLVGNWVLTDPWEAKAGSISDIIAPVHIEPSTYGEALSLWSAFRNNELIFRINATITGSITWGVHKIYRISSSVPDIEFLVGAEYDRGLCKCTKYLTPV